MNNNKKEEIQKLICELKMTIMEDFISKDGKMSLEEIKTYRSLEDFANMMFDVSFKDNCCDYINKHLNRLKEKA